MPDDLLPIAGSEAAKLRKQRLQRQTPAHDIDASLCHALSPEEIQQLEDYVAHIRKHSVGKIACLVLIKWFKTCFFTGQGKIVQIPILRGNKHNLIDAKGKLLTEHTPEHLATSQPVSLKPSDLANNLHNLSVHDSDKNLPRNRAAFLHSQIPCETVLSTIEEPAETTAYAKNPAQKNYAPQNIHRVVDNQNPVMMKNPQDILYDMNNPEPEFSRRSRSTSNDFTGKNRNVAERIDVLSNKYQYPTSENVAQRPFNMGAIESVPNFDTAADDFVPLPLTTSNVERHQEQFKQGFSDLPSLGAYKNRVPIPVFNAKNQIHPTESDQNMQSVGYIRDIDYATLKPSVNTDYTPIPTCHTCKKIFEDGAIAVSADRTASLWHAGCFNCRTCHQPLADLLYFYHKETDDIYCGRDYALLRGIPRCGACDELIFVREYCLAEERTYHIKHFCCFECDEPLAGKQYVMENNQPICIDCYEKLKAERCTDCGYVIAPDEQGVSLQELHWHASDQCFVCKYCRKPLLGKKLLLRNKTLFCSDVCYKTYFA